MTAEELKSKIKFKQVREGQFTRLYASIELIGEYTIRNDSMDASTVDNAKQNLREVIARAIYEDQRANLYKAIDAVMVNCYPAYGVEALDKAFSELLAAARYQP